MIREARLSGNAHQRRHPCSRESARAIFPRRCRSLPTGQTRQDPQTRRSRGSKNPIVKPPHPPCASETLPSLTNFPRIWEGPIRTDLRHFGKGLPNFFLKFPRRRADKRLSFESVGQASGLGAAFTRGFWVSSSEFSLKKAAFFLEIRSAPKKRCAGRAPTPSRPWWRG